VSAIRVAAAGLVATLALAGCGGAPAPARPPQAAAPFETLTIAPRSADQEQLWDGTVEAVHQATLSAQTAGRVTELPFDVNDFVPQGAVVVRFTDVEQGAAQRAAEAQVRSAEAAFRDAEQQFKRVSDVYARKLVARADLDQATARRDSAKAALDAAQAGLKQAAQTTDYTVVRAPYSGFVTRRFVQIGESVRPGQALISGLSLGELRVTVQVPQGAMEAIRTQQRAALVLTDGRRVPADQVVLFPYADPDTHTFSVRLEFKQADTGLYPGMTAKAAFVTGSAEKLLLPRSALVERGELSGVYVWGADGVALRQLRLGHRYGDEVEVLAGLANGERIARDPDAALDYLARQRGGSRAP
jgi:RND family efflux transporter MFP subunit